MKKFIILFALILAGVIGCFAVAYNNGVYLPGTVTTTVETKTKPTGNVGTSGSDSEGSSEGTSEAHTSDYDSLIDVSPCVFENIIVDERNGFFNLAIAYCYPYADTFSQYVSSSNTEFLFGFHFHKWDNSGDLYLYHNWGGVTQSAYKAETPRLYMETAQTPEETYGSSFENGRWIRRSFFTSYFQEGGQYEGFDYPLDTVSAFVCFVERHDGFNCDPNSGLVISGSDSFTVLQMYESLQCQFWYELAAQ